MALQKNDILEMQFENDNTVVISFLIQSLCNCRDIEQAGEIFKTLAEEKKPDCMIVDFEGVSFFSSQILGLLVDIWRRLSECGGRLMICGVNRNLHGVFKITNLEKLFDFYPGRAEALAAAAEICSRNDSDKGGQ